MGLRQACHSWLGEQCMDFWRTVQRDRDLRRPEWSPLQSEPAHAGKGETTTCHPLASYIPELHTSTSCFYTRKAFLAPTACELPGETSNHAPPPLEAKANLLKAHRKRVAAGHNRYLAYGM